MARIPRPVAASEPVDEPIPGLGELASDPPPRAARAPRRRPGRPVGSRTKVGNQGKIATRSATGRIMSKAQMVDKVSGEIYMWCSLFANGWELAEEARGIADPCARVLFEQVSAPSPDGPVSEERLAAVAARLTAIIARNDKLLATIAKSGIIGEMAALGMLLWPVGRHVFNNHILGSHTSRPEIGTDDLDRRFPVPAFAD